jgi:hypothetical protein
MTVPSGRASSGARSVLRALFCGVFAIVGLVAGGCGNSTFTYGTVLVTVSGDLPSPYTAYIADITSFSLLQSNGNYGYTFQGSSGAGKTVDFTKLADTSEVFGSPAVLEGTYTSAVITVNYGAGANSLAAQLYVDIGGQSQAATILDSTGATPTTITYTVKFDPAHPLVVKKGTPTALDLHFDMAASTTLDVTASSIKATVRPFLTASTQPVATKPLRTRGEFVAVDTTGSNFTINAVAFFDSPSYSSSPNGAIQVQTTDQTTYNVNGVLFRGASGLAAINALPIRTIVAAYGSLGNITATPQKPIFNATEVYAGVAIENLLATRVVGTVASRTGNTFHVHNAELVATNGSTTSGVRIQFLNDLLVTMDATTLVSLDGQPPEASGDSHNLQLLSVGQQVDLEGQVKLDSTGTTITSVDASGGLIRLTHTTAWGTLNSAVPGTATANLVSLGGAEPGVLTFTGTGSATGADADPTAYDINTGTVDLSTAAATTPLPLFRFDGIVNSFGAAPPDFVASAATAGDATEQVLAIDWLNGGTAAPFLSSSSAGIVVNIGDANLGASRAIQTGPTSIDLYAANVSPTIVADASLTGQFSIGNPASTTGINVFHSFAAYLTQLGTVLNGTNKLQKLVAVGHWDDTAKTFTAYRIDIVQLP